MGNIIWSMRLNNLVDIIGESLGSSYEGSMILQLIGSKVARLTFILPT